MEVNTMLCLKRSDLSGFNEGATRRKLFTSMSPTRDSRESSMRSQASSQLSSRGSSMPSTPPKRSILRAQDVSPSQGSPSSVRSVRFSGKENDFTVECTKIHVNESTQTSTGTEMSSDGDKGTQTMDAPVKQSVKDTYIDSVSFPKAQRSGSRQSSPIGWKGDTRHHKPTSIQSSKAVQTAVPNVPDGRRILQNMELTPVLPKIDGQRIIKNLEFSNSREKQVQTEEMPTFSSKATQSPVVPDGNRIVKNLDIDMHKSKITSSTTQTLDEPDGHKIVRNMDLDKSVSCDLDEPITKDIAIQTGSLDISTQTPTIPDGNRIVKNLEIQIHPPRDPEPFAKSISIQTADPPLDENSEDGQRIIQNIPLERIRSPSPETNDRSFGFDVNSSFASTQTDPEIELQRQKTDTFEPENEPVLIYNKDDVSKQPVKFHPDDTDFMPPSLFDDEPVIVTDVSNKSTLTKHNAKMLLERQTAFTSERMSRPLNKNTTNTQTTGSDLKPSPKPSNYDRPMPNRNSSRGTNTTRHDDTLHMPADQWIAQTVSTKLRHSSPPQRDTIHVMPISSYGMKQPTQSVHQNKDSSYIGQNYAKNANKMNKPTVLSGTYPPPQMNPVSTTSTNESVQSRLRQSSPVSLQRSFMPTINVPVSQSQYFPGQDTTDGLYNTTQTQATKQSKMDSFSRSSIDVYSFDPESVRESKKLLSKSTVKENVPLRPALKESITKNSYIKGIALNTNSSIKPRPISSNHSTAKTSGIYNSYTSGSYYGRTSPAKDFGHSYSTGGTSYSSRYTSLSRSKSAGPVPKSSTYTSTYTSNYRRPRSASSPRSSYRGYSSQPNKSSLTPNLNQMRTTVIRKNSMNAGYSVHAKRPSSPQVPTRPNLEQPSYNETAGTKYTLEHRSRSREKARGANSKSGEIYNKRGTPLYLESLTDSSNVRPRSKENLSKSRSPHTNNRNDTEHRYGEHYRSRSSSANELRNLNILHKPPLPKTSSRKSSPSPRRQPVYSQSSTPLQPQGEQGMLPPNQQRDGMPQPSYLDKYSRHDSSPSRAQSMDEHQNGKLTIGTAPVGLIDKNFIYLDEQTIQRIIESANL